MAKTMLIDATHPEETRVAVVDGRKLEEFDVEVASRRPLKGNIYLAKVTRVEPSLQAAFVEYGGNRHGFLAFSEIHPDYYRIPIADREALLRAAAEELEDDDGDDFDRHRQYDHDHDHHHDDHDHHHHDDQEHGDQDGDQDHGHDGNADEGAPGQAETGQTETGLAENGSGEATTDDGRADLIVGESGEFVASPAEPAHVTFGTNSPSSDMPNEPEDASREIVETIALATTRPDALRGEFQAFEQTEFTAESHHAFDSNIGEAVPADNDDVPASQHAEIVEVAVPEEAPGPDETPIQDDPEADEERARRRRQRNMRRYKIQEVIKRRQILLVQVTKEERGNKGAALTTYLSLAGRYCVLMPNTDRGGGISRRITSATDRKRLKSIIDDLDAPEGMAVIVRTAGSERSKAEVKRDFEYLLRLWDEIRDVTLRSTAPALIYEEASLIKRSIRDLYTRDIGDIIVAGGEAYMAAKSFMRTLTPSHAKRVQLYRDASIPLFQRYQIESQLAAIHQPVVQLKSGGYIVINQTEALVAVDVNSGRSTKERNIEETALRTNLEAADEVARQLRLRDLAGLIVIDFIDMEENRNNAAVERRMKEALKNDRARIQIGRISSFGLLEMSRQRLHPSLAEASTEICPHCAGTGRIRSVDSTALHVLRMVEEEITRSYSPGVAVMVPGAVALYILNQKRGALAELEQRRGVRIYLESDDSLIPPDYRLERIKQLVLGEEVQQRQLPPITVVEEEPDIEDEVEIDEDETADNDTEEAEETAAAADGAGQGGEGRGRRRRRRKRTGRGERFRADEFTEASEGAPAAEGGEQAVSAPLPAAAATDDGAADDEDDGHDDGDEDEAEAAGDGADGDQPRRRRRRGRRGGRRRSRRPQDETAAEGTENELADSDRSEPGASGEPAHQASTNQPWMAGAGDQPSLPDVLPTYWQQQAPATNAGDATPDLLTTAATSSSPEGGTVEAAGPAAESDPAPADQGNTRRRSRRDDGERPARTRKPRRSRDEPASETGNGIAATPAAESPVAKPAPVEAPHEAPAQATESVPVQHAASAATVPVPSAAPTHTNGSDTASSTDTTSEVTVIGETASAEDAPKRRGWWRRLME